MFDDETPFAYVIEKMAAEHFHKVAKLASDIKMANSLGSQLAHLEKQAMSPIAANALSDAAIWGSAGALGGVLTSDKEERLRNALVDGLLGATAGAGSVVASNAISKRFIPKLASLMRKRASFLGAVGNVAKKWWQLPTWAKAATGVGTVGTLGAGAGLTYGGVKAVQNQMAVNQAAQHGAYQYGRKTGTPWMVPQQM